jgi:hypothetical protein
MRPNNFSEYYKTISNAELLAILDTPEDYQPDAIEAARFELMNRQLTEVEIIEANQINLSIQEKKVNQYEKEAAIKNKVKNTWTIFIETLNPIQTGIQTAEKIIRFILVVYGLYYLYFLITTYPALPGFFRDLTLSPLGGFLELLPFWVWPLALLLFWKRKRAGWIMFTFYLGLTSLFIITELISLTIGNQPKYEVFEEYTNPPISSLIQLLMLAATFYMLCKPLIRNEFSVNKDKVFYIMLVLTILFVLNNIIPVVWDYL